MKHVNLCKELSTVLAPGKGSGNQSCYDDHFRVGSIGFGGPDADFPF